MLALALTSDVADPPAITCDADVIASPVHPKFFTDYAHLYRKCGEKLKSFHVGMEHHKGNTCCMVVS